MIIKVGKSYKDRNGDIWTVTDINGRSPWPVSGGRWLDKSIYRTRNWKLNGTWHLFNAIDTWDLVEEL